MRFGRLAATAAICVAALGSAAPANASADPGDVKVKQCKKKEHPRFACARAVDATSGDGQCRSGYVLVDYKAAPDTDVNGNLVVCYAEGLGAVDDTP